MTPLGTFLIRLFAVSAGAGFAMLFRLDRELVVRGRVQYGARRDAR